MKHAVIRRIVSFILVLVLCTGLVPPTQASAAYAFDATNIDYRAWSQDQLPWGIQKLGDAKEYGGFNKAGCLFISFAKLAVQAGVREAGKEFNPAIVNALFEENDVTNSSGEMYVKKRATAAQLVGLTYEGEISYNNIMSYMKRTDKNYYVILYKNFHYVPIDKATTLSEGKVYYHESWRFDPNKCTTDEKTVASTYSTRFNNEKDYVRNLVSKNYGAEYTSASSVWLFSAPDPNTVTVILNASGGTVSLTSLAVKKNSTYGTLPTPTRPGYIFKGWYTAASGGTKVTGSTKLVNNSVHTLYAQWTACKHSSYYGGICKTCQYEYPYKVTAMSATPYKITKSGGSPIWNRPYSENSTKLRTMANGSTVVVVGKATNIDSSGKAHNLWYLLSDGSWVYSGNVKKTSINTNNLRYVYNTDGSLNVNKQAKSGNSLITVPEGGSVIINTAKSTSSWLYVTYNGVSGYSYYKYLTKTAPTATTAQDYNSKYLR